MAGIFLCYRRDDAGGYAGWIYERLKGRYPKTEIFRDIDTIKAGENFVERIEEYLTRSDVLIVLMGKRWLTEADENGRRIDNPDDFVRLEIKTALDRRIRVIPALVGGAKLPPSETLPESLRPLNYFQAIEITDTRFEGDFSQLAIAVQDAMSEAIRDRKKRLKAEEALVTLGVFSRRQAPESLAALYTAWL